MARRIYLDHNATTPLREEVVEACTRAFRSFGNPSSTHFEGAAARAELERARARVASLLGADPAEIVFTSGATESNNLALQGALGAGRARSRLVTSRAEHPSVLEPAESLERAGVKVTRLPVDASGRLDPRAVASAVESEATLVSVLWANNETGVLQPLSEIAEAVKARGALLHVDATQAVGKIPVRVDTLPADLLSGSAHKLNGPKGAGFLFVRRGLDLEAWLRGGPQERRRRGGTENVVGIVGLGVACELAERELPERAWRTAELRDRLWQGLRAKVGAVRRNASASDVLPNTLNVCFEGAEGEVLLEALDLEGVSVSAGAACHSGSSVASHVLLAMGLSAEEARSSLRFSVGHGVDEAQIDHVLGLLPDLVARVREVGAP
ncbi:MAG TPA: cysteine desulfurase family protein [Myxococcota bacterium]|nr:cysteine desulfurase family protein [Myxococcota bacterium]